MLAEVLIGGTWRDTPNPQAQDILPVEANTGGSYIPIGADRELVARSCKVPVMITRGGVKSGKCFDTSVDSNWKI